MSVVLGLRYDSIEMYLLSNNTIFYVVNGKSVWKTNIDPLLQIELNNALIAKNNSTISIDSSNEESNTSQNELSNASQHSNTFKEPIEEPLEFGFDDFESSAPIDHSLLFKEYLLTNKISPYTPLSDILRDFQYPLSQAKSRLVFKHYCTQHCQPKIKKDIKKEFLVMLQDCPLHYEYNTIKYRYRNDLRWKLVDDKDRRMLIKQFKNQNK